MNLISYDLQQKYGWSLRKRLVIISIISSMFVMFGNTMCNWYGYIRKEQFFWFYIRIFIWHFLTYNIIIYYLEKNMPLF